MTRVYLINIGFRLAGVERRFANIWRALRARGHVEPILVIPTILARHLRLAGLLPPGDAGLLEVPVPAGMDWLANQPILRVGETLRAGFQSRVVARGYRRVWAQVVADRDAVLHVGMPCSSLVPPDMPAVFECMDATLASFRKPHYRRASARRVVVHCQTRRIKEALAAAYTDQSTQWDLVHGESYFADYANMPDDVSRDPRHIAFVGRFDVIKNPMLFLEALTHLQHAGLDFRATMLGEGPLEQEIEAAIRRGGLQDRVQARFEPRPVRVLAQSAVYVSLQTSDNFGSQALLEAMGAGCAVVATDVGETRRLVTPEVGATVPADAGALAQALAAALEHPEATRQQGEAAARIARTQYSADAYAASLEALYRRATHWHRDRRASYTQEGQA